MKKTNPTTEDFLNAAPWFLVALMIAAIMLAGCTQYQRAQSKAWWQLHGSQVGQSALIIGKQVITVAGPELIKAVLASRDPSATQDWQDYFAANLNAQKWNALAKTPNLAIALADVWKRQAPDELKPGVDLFNQLWAKTNPQSEAEVGAFILAYSKALNAPRNMLSDFK